MYFWEANSYFSLLHNTGQLLRHINSVKHLYSVICTCHLSPLSSDLYLVGPNQIQDQTTPVLLIYHGPEDDEEVEVRCLLDLPFPHLQQLLPIVFSLAHFPSTIFHSSLILQHQPNVHTFFVLLVFQCFHTSLKNSNNTF